MKKKLILTCSIFIVLLINSCGLLTEKTVDTHVDSLSITVDTLNMSSTDSLFISTFNSDSIVADTLFSN
jgi:hypothetical protein